MQAVAFGMGGGLLQKVNRDTLSFATKLSHVVYADGTPADIMKSPVSDAAKNSFPGKLSCNPSACVETLGHISIQVGCTTFCHRVPKLVGKIYQNAVHVHQFV